jgi:DNA repair exonuclease SbcCD ATPase subunit
MLSRRFIGWALLAGTIVSTVGGQTAWSYLQGFRRLVKDGVNEITTIEFELKRLDQEIVDLTPVMQQNRKVVVELDVEVEGLRDNVSRRQKELQTEFAEMQELRSALENRGQRCFTFSDRKFTREEVEADLARRLASHELKSKQLETCERLLISREQKLKQAGTHIVSCDARKQELAMMADDLSARLKMTRIAQQTGDLELGGTEFGRVNELMADIDKRVRTMEKVVDQEHAETAIPVNLDVRTVTQRFDERFANAKSPSDK